MKIKEADGVYTNDSPEWNAGPLKDLSRSIKAGNHDAGVLEAMEIEEADGIYLFDSPAWSKAPLKGVSRCIKAEKNDAAAIITFERGGLKWQIV